MRQPLRSPDYFLNTDDCHPKRAVQAHAAAAFAAEQENSRELSSRARKAGTQELLSQDEAPAVYFLLSTFYFLNTDNCHALRAVQARAAKGGWGVPVPRRGLIATLGGWKLPLIALPSAIFVLYFIIPA